MNFIDDLIVTETESFSSKKVQMFTLFALAFDFIDNKISITEEVKQYFVQFVGSCGALAVPEDEIYSTQEEAEEGRNRKRSIRRPVEYL